MNPLLRSCLSALLLCCLILVLVGGKSQVAHSPPETNSFPPEDFCKLTGTVYIETVPSFATYRVFVEPTEFAADMRIYKEEVQSFATDPGVWHFTDVRGFANFSIYLEPQPEFADFRIFYTNFRTDAGCD